MGLRKKSPAAGEFLLEIDSEPLPEQVTARGGIPLLVRAARSLDVAGRVERHVRLKQRERGLDEASYVESFLVLNAVGGDCLEDFDQLREDAGVAEMLGHAVPSAEAARKFLYQFHEGEKMEQAPQELAAARVSYIPEENAGLRGLGQVNQDGVRELGRRGPEQKVATLDVGVFAKWLSLIGRTRVDHASSISVIVRFLRSITHAMLPSSAGTRWT